MILVATGGIGIATFAAFLLTRWVRSYALNTDVLDIPNARSSHNAPVPRGGGLAIVAVLLTGLLVLVSIDLLSVSSVIALWVGGAAVASTGWLDDRYHVRADWRLMIHIVASVWVVFWAGLPPELPLPGGGWEWGWIGAVAQVLFISWLLNLSNFMDGIDGLAGTEAVTVAGSAAVLLWWLDSPAWAIATALIASASLGFLVCNWPPAKIFMGDAGSGFLGFMFAGFAVLTWADGVLVIWVWPILLGVFIVDASVTLARRILRGERFYEAHRSHAYQHAARHYGAHMPVTVGVGLVNLLWLTPIAWLAASWPAWGLPLLVLAWLPLAAMCLRFHAGLPE